MAQRKYDREFKINAVNLYRSGKKPSAVCKDLNIPDATFYYWIDQYAKEGEKCLKGSGLPKVSQEELVRLRKELDDVRLERDILKKAVAIFSKQR